MRFQKWILCKTKKTIELCNEWILHLHNTHNAKKEAIDDRDSLLERVREEKKEGNRILRRRKGTK